MRRRAVDLWIDTLSVFNDRSRVARALTIKSEAVIRLPRKSRVANCSRRPRVKQNACTVEAETVDHARLSALVRERRRRWVRRGWR